MSWKNFAISKTWFIVLGTLLFFAGLGLIMAFSDSGNWVLWDVGGILILIGIIGVALGFSGE